MLIQTEKNNNNSHMGEKEQQVGSVVSNHKTAYSQKYILDSGCTYITSYRLWVGANYVSKLFALHITSYMWEQNQISSLGFGRVKKCHNYSKMSNLQ